MGTDIHMFVEKKFKNGWKRIGGFVSDYYREGHDYFGKDEYKKAYSPWTGRNYDLFAVLADVRNGFGFGGCVTGDPVEPLAPKGLPEDISNSVLEEADNWGEDGHTHSWLTVKELEDYDWDAPKVYVGVVNESEYRTFKEKGSPDNWCGDVGGYCTVKVNNGTMDKILQGTFPKEEGKQYYTTVTWKTTIRDSVSHFLDHALPQLVARCSDKKHTDVRIVFWFDN